MASGRLAFGISPQSGALAFKRDVEATLAQWRELIVKDDARVVRSIHVPCIPNSVEGNVPVTVYQIAHRQSGKVVTLSIQGKHVALPNPCSSLAEASRPQKRRNVPTSRSASNGESHAAMKRRLQTIREDDDSAAAAAAAAAAANVTVEPEGIQQEAGEYSTGEMGCHGDLGGEEEETVAQRTARWKAAQALGSAYPYERGEGEGEEELHSRPAVHISLHGSDSERPISRPSSRRPQPGRYSTRRSGSVTPIVPYGPNDVRVSPLDNVAPSSAASAGQSEAGDSEATWETHSNATVTPTSAQTHRPIRRSSRLASLAPGSDVDQVLAATANRFGAVALSEAGDAYDVDMSSINIEYADPEEQRLAAEQEAALRDLPPAPEDELAHWVGYDGRIIKPEGHQESQPPSVPEPVVYDWEYEEDLIDMV